MSKFYAIKKGQHPKTKQPVENLILELPWSEVEPYVKGVQGAIFKGFKTKEDAEAYLTNSNKKMDPNALHCYVDGSYHESAANYGYGLVCVKNGKLVHTEWGTGNNKDAIEMYQVAGELLGAIKALLYAKKQKVRNVVICHDYEGTRRHATGEWKRKNEHSKTYYDWMQNFFEKNPEIKVDFQKVDAHTGDDFNEIADGLAKLAVGIKPNQIFYRMVDKHGIGSLLKQ